MTILEKKIHEWVINTTEHIIIVNDSGNLYNIMNNGKLMLKKGFIDIGSYFDFKEFGYTYIKDQNNNRFIINNNLTLGLKSPYNLDLIYEISAGYMLVKHNNKFHLLDKNRRPLLDSWEYEYQHNLFSEGFCVVFKDESYNFIDKKGNFILTQRTNYAINRFEGGYALCENGKGNYNFIKNNGQLLFNKWLSYHYVDFFYDEYARIELIEGQWNYIDHNGVLLLKDNVDGCYSFHKGFGVIEKNNSKYIVNKQGIIYGPYNQVYFK